MVAVVTFGSKDEKSKLIKPMQSAVLVMNKATPTLSKVLMMLVSAS